jgi:hypothetical protein
MMGLAESMTADHPTALAESPQSAGAPVARCVPGIPDPAYNQRQHAPWKAQPLGPMAIGPGTRSLAGGKSGSAL